MIRCERLRNGSDTKPVAMLNPWKRRRFTPMGMNFVAFKSINLPKCQFNSNDADFDVFTKRAILKVSPSVVALISYSGGQQAFWGSGVVFGSFWNNNSLYYSVLTSATLLRPPPLDARVANDNNFLNIPKQPVEIEDYDCLPVDERIDVCLKGGELCEGTIVTCDFHYNIAVLSFKSDKRVPCAVLRPLDDSLALNNAPTDDQASAGRFPYLPINLIPGDKVIAVARFVQRPFEIMGAPGKYSADYSGEKTKLNCVDLLTTDCKITKCGIGGPLISSEGEVIGINFYAEHCTPFLPINIFLKWWSHHKITRNHCRPSLGMKVVNLHTSNLVTSDEVQKLGISQGVIIEKVLTGSPAESCGLRPGDVMLKCSETIVISPLQLFNIIWDMVGKIVEVVLLRDGSYRNIKILVKDVTSADEFYQWPLPKTYRDR